jgi:hypothetical protein
LGVDDAVVVTVVDLLGVVVCVEVKLVVRPEILT